METRIAGGDAFSYLDVTLAPGESILAEADGMSTMSAKLDLGVRTNGGLFVALLRKWLGGETFFINRFVNNTREDCRLTLVQPTPGGLRCEELQGNAFCLQPGAFLACTDGVKIGLRFAGFISWIAKEGLFRIEVSGHGKVWYGAYGTLVTKHIDGEYLVDSSHLVAYEPQMKLHLQLAGGLFSSFFGGEGLVTRVVGRGRIVMQTRSLEGLAGWINPKMPV